MPSMKTKVNLNTPTSPSLRSTIPIGIAEFLDLKPGDTIDWSFENINDKRIVVIRKV